MSTYYKPRTFRSMDGCCVCRCKSSSSRFTDSSKYQPEFMRCFGLSDRSGEICNACVLLVKRSRKLPPGSTKNWQHVVDSRAGTGGSRAVCSRQRAKIPQQLKEDPDVRTRKIVRRQPKPDHPKEPGTAEDGESSASSHADDARADAASASTADTESDADDEENPFAGHGYWKRLKVCCGIVYVGMSKELLIDRKHFSPCQLRRKSSTCSAGSVGGSSRSRADTFSSNSSNPALSDSPSTTPQHHSQSVPAIHQ